MDLLLLVLLIGGIVGYLVKGNGQKELGALKADVHAFAARLESAASAEDAKLKTEVVAVVADIKKKL